MDDLRWLLDHELQLAFRHRRYVALVMVGAHNGQDGLSDLPIHCIRAADEFITLRPPGAAVLLMSETDEAGAAKAVERLKERCAADSPFCFAISSYPRDGKSASDILATAQRRLERARERGAGAIISEG
ncbi:MAG: hypothetical protein NTW86_15440 [Candidatus Sumerlaeota bacterium]|nr:hypothetical protein [Candidatus Sumerlaeota bacterium]